MNFVMLAWLFLFFILISVSGIAFFCVKHAKARLQQQTERETTQFFNNMIIGLFSGVIVAVFLLFHSQIMEFVKGTKDLLHLIQVMGYGLAAFLTAIIIFSIAIFAYFDEKPKKKSKRKKK